MSFVDCSLESLKNMATYETCTVAQTLIAFVKKKGGWPI